MSHRVSRFVAALLICGSTFAVHTQAPPPAATAAATASPAANTAGAADEKPIREVLNRYVAALNNRSVDMLREVWPTMTPAQVLAIRGELEQARLVHVELVDPRITLNDKTAQVVTKRRYTMLTPGGTSSMVVKTVTFNLRRTADAWQIEKILYQL